ncbi:MAG: NAD(P)H-dependent oxidoreductase [Flavobacteriales bacterium]|nr:NAD(P)H-dependent oxidoreductase [Flavobacteriales bacterium]
MEFDIRILSASIRQGRNSHRVALYLRDRIEEPGRDRATVLDLNALDLPLFHERLRFMTDPPAVAKDLSSSIGKADGVIIVTPEYNGGYPAALKNVVDLLYDEWHRKPVAIVTASDGSFGGTQVITSLQFTLWKMRAWTVPTMMPVPHVQEAFDEAGKPADRTTWGARSDRLLNELTWCMTARRRMDMPDGPVK